MKITDQKLKELIREEIQNFIEDQNEEPSLSEAPGRMQGGQFYELQQEVERLAKVVDDNRKRAVRNGRRLDALVNK